VDDASPSKTVDGIGQGHGQAAFDVQERVQFGVTGTWRLRYLLDGRTLADAPLRVVANAAQVRNRAPNPIAVSTVVTNGIAQCIVATSLVARDPDFDVVRYRYRWRVGSKVLRTLTSAALSDVLPLPASGSARCEVTPSDGKLSGPAVAATATA
jgi:hypothetical protein